MIAGEEQLVLAAEVEGEAHGLGQRRDDVHVDAAQILAGFALEILRAALEHGELMVHAPADVGQRAAEMRADELQPGMLVQQAAGDDARHGDGVFKHVSQRAGELIALRLLGGQGAAEEFRFLHRRGLTRSRCIVLHYVLAHHLPASSSGNRLCGAFVVRP